MTRTTFPLASHLSRSFQVIGTDTDRSGTYDFILTIHNNHGRVLPFPKINNEILAENSHSFSEPRLFNVPAEDVPIWKYNTNNTQAWQMNAQTPANG